jgi:hypothetical protein
MLAPEMLAERRIDLEDDALVPEDLRVASSHCPDRGSSATAADAC